MTETLSPILQAQALLEQSLQTEKHLKVAQKLLRDLTAHSHDLRRVKQRTEQLAKVDLPDGLQSSLAGLCHDLAEWVGHEERQRPLRLGRELREAAAAQELVCEPLTSSPPVYRLAPFTVELHYGRGVARLEYAGQPLGECPLEAARILDLHQSWLGQLDSPFEPESYLEKLFRAYRRRLEVCQLPAGERVDVVDVLPELTMLMQPEAFLRDPSRENFKPYAKVRFAYDLARLRRSGKLDYRGFRLTLGSATVGSTRDKSRVLFVEDGGRGQYYLSLWFTGTKN